MMESQSEQGPETTSKSRTACILCRSRKVKCDKQLPGCERCQNLGVRCPGYSKDGESRLSIGSTETVDSIFRTAGIERRKIGACRECRSTKSKCSQTRPQCQRCRAKSLPCTYASKVPKIRHIEPALSSSAALIADETDVMSTASASTSAPERPLEDGESSWLYSSELPALKNIRVLADLYFAHVHPLRSMGFLHKPSFMRALDRNDLISEYGEALVYAICALGARFIESDNGASTHLRAESSERIPGKQWGEQARKLVRLNSCIPSVRNLMSLVLYCEYGLRTGDNAFVFMLTGCCCRMGRLLRLDVEPSTAQKTLSPGELTKQECHRRLMWSCYILDSFVGAGVEGNLCWVEGAPKIPLPCRETEFLNQTRTTPVFLEFDKDLANPTVTDVDIRGQIVRIMYLRTQVLRCIRSHYPGNGSEPPIWNPSSRFMCLLSSIENWHQSLPGNLTFEDMNIYIQKDQQNLGALFFMHLVYNACIFDLTRITLAGYNFPLSAALSNAPAEFKALQQEKCYHHADVVSQILRSALACGIGSLDDHYTSTAAFESTKVQVIYITTLARGDFDTYSRVVANINTNLEILTLTHRYADMPNVYLSALCPYLVQFGFPDIAARWEPFKNTVLFPPAALAEEVDVDTPNSTEVVGPVEASYLNQIATFRLARLEVKTPERESTPREEPAGPYQQLPIVSSQQQPQYRTERTPLPDMTPAAHNTELPAVQIPTQPGPSGVGDFIAGQPMAPQLFPPQGTMPPFTEEHYLRMAEEISDYMTWDGYFQTWSDFPGGDYPVL